MSEQPAGIRPGSRYWASLDGIRGVFMVLIFLYHAHPPLVPGAGISVDAFFVMSAFLITVLLVREHERTGRIDLVAFYRRRVLRLFPAMLVVVPVAAVLAYVTIEGERSEVGPSVLSVFFYYANFRAAAHQSEMSVFLPTWSLSTEEQFYVVWSSVLLLLLALRTRPRLLVGIVAALSVAAAVHLQLAYDRGTDLAVLSYRPDLRVIGILLGTLVGLLHVFDLVADRARGVVRSLVVVGTVFVAYYLARPLTLPKRTILTVAVVAACAVFALLVLQQVRWPVRAYSVVLEARPVVWVGRASYALYLLHVPVLRVMDATVGRHGPVFRVVVGAVVTLVLGWLVHEKVEKPALRRKARTSVAP